MLSYIVVVVGDPTVSDPACVLCIWSGLVIHSADIGHNRMRGPLGIVLLLMLGKGIKNISLRCFPPNSIKMLYKCNFPLFLQTAQKLNFKMTLTLC